MSLSPRHLLVQFGGAPNATKFYKRILKLGLDQVRSTPAGKRGRKDFLWSLNNTKSRFWCQIKRKISLDGAFIRSLEEAAGSRVTWLAPVYRLGQGRGVTNLVSPVPHVLLIKIPDDMKPELQEGLLSDVRKLGLKEDSSKSEHLTPYHYYVLERPLEMSAYEIKEQIASGKYKGVDIRHEMMPMVTPTTMIPNDTLYPQQWNMDRIRAGGPIPSAWDLGTGARDVVVCILDSGCDLSHPDLQFIDHGINLGSMSGNGGPTGDHGTACAGVCAAVVNNGLGVAGVAGNCLILPLAFENWTDVEVASGISYAADQGAHVISMSFGQYGANEGMGPSGWDFGIINVAIEKAFESGVVLVAASGNENSGAHNRYPARHRLVMAVGASDQNDNRKSPNSPDGENWGANYGAGISVVAPGVRIPTTDRRAGDGYSRSAGAAGDYFAGFNGTSAATPHVAGLAALVKSICPTRSNVDVRNIIERTADKVGSVAYAAAANYPNGTRNVEMGYGRVNVDRAAKESMLYSVACLAQM